MSPPLSMFKTPAGEARYFAAYNATLALWSVPVMSLTVATRFGSTHVNVCGPDDAPALVLLHGAALSSTMWYPNIRALSQTYRVYAPDIMGEMGKSICTQPVKGPADYLDWLIDVFAGLKLGRAHVAGLSFGGYLATQIAQACPERVAKLILLSPATLLPIRPAFYLRMAAAIFVPFLASQTREKLIMGTASPHASPAIKQMMTPHDFRYKLFFPPVNKDQELSQIKASTLLLLGDHEVIYNPKSAQKRAKTLIPQVDTHILPGAGHILNLDQPEMVNQHILEFLSET